MSITADSQRRGRGWSAPSWWCGWWGVGVVEEGGEIEGFGEGSVFPGALVEAICGDPYGAVVGDGEVG